MKYKLITIVLVMLLAMAAGGATYRYLRPPAELSAQGSDSLQWLRTEFRLDEGQIRRIEKLHTAYEDVCAAHCAAIKDARDQLATLRAASATGPALHAAEQQLAETETTCRTSTEAHVRAVAALMGDGQGARYLAVVLPRLAGVAHTGAPDLQANSAGARHGH